MMGDWENLVCVSTHIFTPVKQELMADYLSVPYNAGEPETVAGRHDMNENILQLDFTNKIFQVDIWKRYLFPDVIFFKSLCFNWR